MTQIEQEKKRWESTTVQKFLNRSGERKSEFCTDSGIPLDRLFVPRPRFDYLKQLGFPGEYPFTRGVYPTMYRGRFWTMRQYAGYATAEESNQRFRYLLESGTTGLSVAFDLPTQIGYDSDDPMAEGEVGRVGVAIDSLEDMERLFEGIPLDRVSTSMTINATAAILLAMYIAVGRKQGVPMEKLSGTVQNDILKEYIARGTYIFPPEPSMRIITDIFKFCAQHMPRWNTISISGYHIREAGATAVQEVAFTLANAISYVRAAIEAGLDVDEFAGQLSFFFNAHNNLLEEVAKFRAARRLWARIMKERFGARSSRSMMLRFHAQTAGSSLTAQQPLNNIVRTTVQALAAVLGGAQSLHTNSYDEALALPTKQAVTVALRTQQILAYESGVGDTVDPLGGSYAIEALTDEIEARAAEYIDQIEAMGGSVQAILKHYFQNEIAREAYQYQRAVESGERIIVGVNAFTQAEDMRVDILKIDEQMVARQIDRLKALRKRRDQARVQRTLQALEQAARGQDNLMPRILDCVEAYATIGEICRVLRQVFGEYHDL
ncbi:MAG: methylmalonyl-CoA mutase [Calditrichaeota bacterium]|nr:MAG: methylmalonyl-CoA mutase [Calditrichota bacterium]